MTRLVFDGSIAGVGTAQGTRLALGLWSSSPFGPVVDVMIEAPDGHRTLIAPSAEVADFIATTYRFDDVRVERTALHATPGTRTVTTDSLAVTIELGRRTAVGRLLALVPRPIARTSWWCRAIGPFARALRPGTGTWGTAGGGRREYYCALDEHAVSAVRARWDGVDLGELRPVLPPVRFGFASTPSRPAIVRVTTLIDPAAGRSRP